MDIIGKEESQPLVNTTYKSSSKGRTFCRKILPAICTLLFCLVSILLVGSIVAIVIFSFKLYGGATHFKFGKKVSLSKPEPILPPSPAILMSVRGNSTHPDDIMLAWTSILEWNPAIVSIVLTPQVVAYPFVLEHGTFVLNLVPSEYAVDLDRVDLANKESHNKFHPFSRFTKGEATSINAPNIEQSLVQLECNVTKTVELHKNRYMFIAEVLETKIDENIFEPSKSGGSVNLLVRKAPFFGMAAGSSEYFEMGKKVGHIFMSRE